MNTPRIFTSDEYKIEWTDMRSSTRQTDSVHIDSAIKGGNLIMAELKFELCRENAIPTGEVMFHSVKKVRK